MSLSKCEGEREFLANSGSFTCNKIIIKIKIQIVMSPFVYLSDNKIT